jgi:hypothetical protein
MSTETDNNGMNAYSFCTVSGNPPVWGCSLCDWRFTNPQCDPLSIVPSLEQARAAHIKHVCLGTERRPPKD